MKKVVITIILIASASTINAIEPKVSVESGENNGFGTRAAFGVYQLNRNYPLFFETGVSFSYQGDPGSAEDARKVFINDNAGGDIEEFGTTVILSADLGYRFWGNRDLSSSLFGGPRYSFYRANFIYNGDNEEFAVKHDAPGLGAGLRTDLRITNDLTIFLKGGIDYFFQTKLHGHGEFTYNPNDKDNNPRNDYTYEDADKAVNQPYISPAISFGVSYSL
jgi:hypothetical protein